MRLVVSDPPGTHMIDELGKAARHRAMANAIASVRLEGLSVDAVTTDDLYRHARGEIELDEVAVSLTRAGRRRCVSRPAE